MGQRPKLLDFGTVSERAEFIRNNPIGFRENGKPIFLIAGGSGEDEDEDDDDAGGADDGAKVSLDRFLKVQKRMRAADRRASTAEGRVTELEKQLEDLPGLQKKVSDYEADIKKLRLDNAFLSANDVDWHDAEAALRLADLSEVKIGDDGTVTGLKEALKKLSEAKPYLVKKAEEKGKGQKDDDGDGDDGDDEDDDDIDDENDDQENDNDTSGGGADNGRQGGGASGTSTGSGKRRKSSKGPTDAELLARYRI